MLYAIVGASAGCCLLLCLAVLLVVCVARSKNDSPDDDKEMNTAMDVQRNDKPERGYNQAGYVGGATSVDRPNVNVASDTYQDFDAESVLSGGTITSNTTDDRAYSVLPTSTDDTDCKLLSIFLFVFVVFFFFLNFFFDFIFNNLDNVPDLSNYEETDVKY